MGGSKHVKRALTLAILMLSGAGVWISGELVKQNANLWNSKEVRAGLFARMCDATERAGFSCSEATSGAWSRIRIPIPVPSGGVGIRVHTVVVPVAFLGLAYFVFMGVWFVFVGGPRPYGSGWHRIPLIVGFCGIAVSLFYIGIMAVGSAPWCIWCLVVHAINLLTVLSAWTLYRVSQERGPKATLMSPYPEQRPHMVLTPREVANAIAFSLIIINGLWFYRRERIAIQERIDGLLPHKLLVESLQENPDFLLREYYAQPVRTIVPRTGEFVGDGRAQLVLFTDFECPYCYCTSRSAYGEIAKAFDGQLDVTIRHFPLSNACNEYVDTAFHRHACDAAYAAEAARRLGGESAFRHMSSLLYRNRKALGGDVYRSLAAKISLDPGQFIEEWNGDAVRNSVDSDIALAHELGVTGTPAMFLNGRRVTMLCQVPVFWNAVARDPALGRYGEALAFVGPESSVVNSRRQAKDERQAP